LQSNICKPETFGYYSYFNEDESTLPELPETILAIIWEFYPLLDFMGFRDVELPQASPEALKWEMRRAQDLEAGNICNDDWNEWNSYLGPGVFMKSSCEQMEILDGFYKRKDAKFSTLPVYEHVHHGHTLEFNGSSWLMRTFGIRLGALVKDPSKDPTDVQKRWTIYSANSKTICEKRPGWGDKELPILTTELKKASFEVEPMTQAEYRLRMFRSMLSVYQSSKFLLKESNPDVAIDYTQIRSGIWRYKKFELRISNDRRSFYLRFMHFGPNRCQYWFKLSWNDMFDLIYPNEDRDPMGELMGAMCPGYELKHSVKKLVDGRALANENWY